MLATHDATLNFTCVELRTADETVKFPGALADPEGLVSQVIILSPIHHSNYVFPSQRSISTL